MSVPDSIVFATGNPHKLDEVSAILAEIGVTVIGLDTLGVDVPEPVEDGDTFEANAILKARYYAEATGRTVLADDSGLEVDAIAGEPGVISARYAGIDGPRSVVDPANNAKLIGKLNDLGVAPEQRTARFVCTMALCAPGVDEPLALTRGFVEGRIVDPPRGSNGFGYDPHFELPHRGVTTAELPPAEKNAISHRGEATRAMVEKLKEL
ncbi:MAG: RdgB/HAM1 family non-canonical purine NTP pyrophosphatase [Phycisphaera sp.]|nr:RdgB/HAM1 family non-canonical purine NTP pyrophosphatase [Phycisphaera sp.]